MNGYRITQILLLLTGVLTRLHGIFRPFWFDEAWLIEQASLESFPEAMTGGQWIQTAPPGFVFLLRALIAAGIESELGLRLLPTLFSVLSLFFFWSTCKKLFPPLLSIGIFTLFIFSPEIIRYSQELKPYSLDILITTIFLNIALTDKKEFFAVKILTFCLLAPFFSYTAIFLLPSALVSTALSEKKLFPGLPLLIICLAIVSTLYIFFIAPNSAPELHSFFVSGFPNSYTPSGFLSFLGSKALDTGSFLFCGGNIIARSLMLALVISGAYFLYTESKTRKIIAIALPIGSILLTALTGFYPIPSWNHRLTLFLVPCFLLLAGFGAELWSNSFSRPLKRMIQIAIPSLILVAITLYVFVRGPVPFFYIPAREDIPSALNLVKEQAHKKDIFFVDASVSTQVSVYHQMLPETADLLWGTSGHPCCRRTLQESKKKDFPHRLLPHSVSASKGNLWILLTDRDTHWSDLGFDHRKVFREQLSESGCSTEHWKYAGVILLHSQCPGKKLAQ